MKKRKILANKGETLDYVAYKEGCSLITILKINAHLAHKITLEASDIVFIPINEEIKVKKQVRIFG